MRRRLAVLVAAAVMLLAGGVAAAEVETFAGLPVVPVYVNGRLLQTDVPAVILSGRTMVPLRAVSEGLGAQVRWDEAARSVAVSDQEKCMLAGWAVESARHMEESARLAVALGATLGPVIRSQAPIEYVRLAEARQNAELIMRLTREVQPRFAEMAAKDGCEILWRMTAVRLRNERALPVGGGALRFWAGRWRGGWWGAWRSSTATSGRS